MRCPRDAKSAITIGVPTLQRLPTSQYCKFSVGNPQLSEADCLVYASFRSVERFTAPRLWLLNDADELRGVKLARLLADSKNRDSSRVCSIRMLSCPSAVLWSSADILWVIGSLPRVSSNAVLSEVCSTQTVSLLSL